MSVKSRAHLRCFFALLLGLVGLLAIAPATAGQASTSTGSAAHIALQKLGNPAWMPVDLHVFAAPIGTAADGYAEFATTLGNVLPLPHYQSVQCLGIGPGTPEQPPYDHDVADGISNLGYPQGLLFGQQQFSDGGGIYFAYMVVPTPNTPNIGSSPDYASGPIIPNSLFPISVTGVTRRDTAIYDPNLTTFNVPAINDPCVVPSFNVDGFSHFPIFVADNSDFGPPGTKLPGMYTYNLTMQDSAGNGWKLSAQFVIH
jgi:hypothetical protein